MKLDFIDLCNIDMCAMNMRHSRTDPDVSDILPTVRKRGVIVPVIVRPASEEGRYEIVAGRRRVHAARLVSQEEGADPELARLPAAIMEAGDDAAALEASLIENLARLDPDEVSRWENFVRLVKQGRTLDDISTTFGLPELTVRRILALGNLLPRIRDLYRREDIDATTVRHLTLATKSQQKTWLALRDDPDLHAPVGHQLKGWLFGGQAIPVRRALFDPADFKGTILGDLFGEDRYFADADTFWAAQNAVIDARRERYLDEGWSDVVIVPPTEHFNQWEHEKTSKRHGGRVYIVVRSNGEVAFHEGYVSRKEAERTRRTSAGGTVGGPVARPEITSTMGDYVNLHRHAAVRAALIGHGQVALRLMAAHAIVGSHLFRVSPEPQTTRNDALRESVETSFGETAFDSERRAILALLGFSADDPCVIDGSFAATDDQDDGASRDQLSAVFARLLALSDEDILRVIAVVMGEALASGTPVIEALGLHIRVDMAEWWEADSIFLNLIRDREVLGALLGDVSGKAVAIANAGEKTKVLRNLIRDCLDGTNGREKKDRWVPGWMQFPPSGYTERGGVATVDAHALIDSDRLRGDDEAKPDLPLAA